MNKGAAFWLKSTGSAASPGTPHLHCVLTNPCPEGEQLVANVTGRNPGVPADLACELAIGDHPEITKASFIFYEKARVITPKMLEVWTFGHQVSLTSAFGAEVLARICAGVTASKFITPKVRQYYLDHKDL